MGAEKDLLLGFVSFAQHSEDLSEPKGVAYLEDYLSEWLKEGDAIQRSGGDFAAYMRGVVYIIDAWLRNPGLLNRPNDSQRELSGLLVPSDAVEPGDSPEFLDRELFQVLAFGRQVHRR